MSNRHPRQPSLLVHTRICNVITAHNQRASDSHPTDKLRSCPEHFTDGSRTENGDPNGQTTDRYGLATDSRSAHTRTKHGLETDGGHGTRMPLSLVPEPGAPCLLSFIWISPCVVCFANPPRDTRLAGKSKRQKSRRAKRPDGKRKSPSGAKPEGLKWNRHRIGAVDVHPITIAHLYSKMQIR